MSLPQDWVDHCKSLLTETIFSPANPGKWAGKEKGHTPMVEKDGNETTITVNHVMKKGETEDEDHFIEMVFVVSEDEVVAAAKFTPTDAEPKLSFTAEEGKSYTPYSHCNLHGVWKGDDF
eukprot:m.134394 g.134394  ORF g.134394 m.134394 type:complete len:120 (-) comp9586_c0_seq1:117-476(-)